MSAITSLHLNHLIVDVHFYHENDPLFFCFFVLVDYFCFAKSSRYWRGVLVSLMNQISIGDPTNIKWPTLSLRPTILLIWGSYLEEKRA